MSLAFAILMGWGGLVHPAGAETSCDAAALKAERDWNLPAGVLAAVGSVESGIAGRVGAVPWPWTINAAGRGSHHGSKGDAIATVLTIMTRGFPYIDVGCFQVDLMYHAGVFRSLDEAFDPERNAQAAAKILLSQRMTSPDWPTAIARYHSRTPELGSAYLQRVRDALPAALARALLIRDKQHPASANPLSIAGIGTKLPVVIYGTSVTRQNSPVRSRRRIVQAELTR